MIKWIAVS